MCALFFSSICIDFWCLLSKICKVRVRAHIIQQRFWANWFSNKQKPERWIVCCSELAATRARNCNANSLFFRFVSVAVVFFISIFSRHSFTAGKGKQNADRRQTTATLWIKPPKCSQFCCAPPKKRGKATAKISPEQWWNVSIYLLCIDKSIPTIKIIIDLFKAL